MVEYLKLPVPIGYCIFQIGLSLHAMAIILFVWLPIVLVITYEIIYIVYRILKGENQYKYLKTLTLKRKAIIYSTRNGNTFNFV